MRYLKQSTSVDVAIGPFLDETDGKTAETALTITQPDIRLKKNGGAWAQKAASQTLSHEENGWYEVTLDATDTDTIGILMVAVHESGALPVWMEFHILAANVYDSLFGAATDKLDVNVEEWNTTAVPAEHTAGYPIVTIKDGTGTGEINTNAGAIANVDLVATLTTYTGNTVQTGDSFARLGAPAGASVSADILVLDNLVDDLESRLGTPSNLGSGATVAANLVDIEGQTDDIGTAGAGLTAVPWNAAWDADVQSEVQDAIEVNHLDHLIAVADPGGVVANSSFLAKLVSKSVTPAFSSYDNTTDSMEALRDRGDAAWITATGFSTHTAADVWAAGTRTLTAATNITSTGGTTVPQTGDSFARIGAAGAGLTDLGGMSTTMKAQVQTEAEDAIVTHRLDELLNADSDIDGAAPPTVGSVFHELMSKTAGSFTFDQTTDSLEAIRDRGDAAWITATSVTVSAGGITSASFAAGAIDNAAFNVTETLTANPAAGGITAASFGAGAIDAAAIAANAIGASELATDAVTEIVSAVLTTQMTEAYAADGVAPTLAQALFLIQQILSEFAISGTTITIKKIDGSTTAATLTLDSGTTPTSATRAT